MRKKWMVSLGALLSLLLVGGAALASDSIKLIVDGKQITTEVPPQIIEGNTMVPVRWVTEALGAKVEWDGDERSVRIDWAERESMRRQIELLQTAIAPETAEEAVRTWAKAVKNRNGAAQYAMLSDELRKSALADLEDMHWSTGISSPWVDRYDISGPVAGEASQHTYDVSFQLKTSTGSAGGGTVKATVRQTDGRWVLAALDASGGEELNGIVYVPDDSAQTPGGGPSIDNPEGARTVGDTAGWAWGTDDDRPVMVRTTDGGKTWSEVSLDSLKLKGADMNRVTAEFAGADTGWLGWSDGEAMHVARTTNGGAAWDVRTFKGIYSPVQLEFVDNSHGWLVAVGEAAMMRNSKIVYRTEDGGATWELVSDNRFGSSGSAATGALPALGTVSGMTFRNAVDGFVAIDNPVSSELLFYRTYDGGRTWSAVSLTLPESLQGKADYSSFSAPVFSGESNADGVLAAKIGSGETASLVVYTTRNGGKTWSGSKAPVSFDPDASYRITFSDAAHGWLLNGSALYRTTDGGSSWNVLKADSTFEQAVKNGPSIRQFSFANERKGVLIVGSDDGKSGSMLETADGGAGWTTVPWK